VVYNDNGTAAGAELYYDNSTANVGIGIASPTEALDVDGNVKLNNSGVAALMLDNSPFDSWQVRVFGGTFSVRQTSPVPTDRLTLTGDGHVGIGTGSPGFVSGSARYLTVRTTGAASLELWGSSSAAEGVQSKIDFVARSTDTNDYNTARIEATNSTSSTKVGVLRFYTADASGLDERMQIDENGNVGIGTTSPAGMLDVNGAIYQHGGVLHADYVFEPDYPLESIAEHAAFMWREKHLPAVPKAERDEHGAEVLEIGAHRRGILEELEKAHVYIAQLNDTVSEQQRVIRTKQKDIEQLRTRVQQLESLEQRLRKLETLLGG